mgnify:CR=1 FL=1
MQSQTSSPSGASTGNIEMEDFKSHTPEISEKIANEVKKQIHEAIEELKLEIMSYVKTEITTLVNELLNIAREEIDKKKYRSMGN